MRTFDFSPLYRSTVGFERLFDMLDQATRTEPMTNWPPYDIERVGDDHYRITLAVAGFSPDEIELTQLENTLVVVGQKKGPGRREALPAPRHRCAHLQADLQRRRARQGDWRHLRKWTAHHRPRARGSRGTETAPGRDCEGGYGPGQQADRARTQAEQGRVTLLHVNGSAGELRHCRMFDRSPCRAHRKAAPPARCRLPISLGK